jgi:hypothetical protein
VLDADLPSVVAHPDVQTKDGECILLTATASSRPALITSDPSRRRPSDDLAQSGPPANPLIFLALPLNEAAATMSCAIMKVPNHTMSLEASCFEIFHGNMEMKMERSIASNKRIGRYFTRKNHHHHGACGNMYCLDEMYPRSG